MNISVCMIVRNEENNIERALRSIPSGFETVVVDTGSTDRTVEIADRCRARVFPFVWNDSFSDARNASISHATGDYILIMDADEELIGDPRDSISRFVAEHPNESGTVWIRNPIGEETHTHRMIRFFPNSPSYQFAGIVHEELRCDGGPAQIHETGIGVLHHGYQPEYYRGTGKQERYEKLYRRHLEIHPLDGYMWYQLGKLRFSLKEFPPALEALSRSYDIHEERSLYFPPMLVLLGYTLKELGHSKDAAELIEHYMPFYPEFPDMPFLAGLLAMENGAIERIRPSFEQAISVGDTDKYTSVSGVGTYKANYNLGVYYEIMRQREAALRCYEDAARQGFAPAIERLAKMKEN